VTSLTARIDPAALLIRVPAEDPGSAAPLSRPVAAGRRS
jgi:hypothetical protein